MSREEQVIDFIKKNGSITNKQAQGLLGLADSTVKRLLTKMTADNLLEAVGERKGRKYQEISKADKTNDSLGPPQEFKANDFLALMIFRPEYNLVKILLDMNKKGHACLPHLMNSILPYIALIAQESSKWLEQKSGEKLFESSSQLNRKRMLFKYFDDTSYTAKEYDEHCAAVLKASSHFFKKPAGLLSFAQQDAGIIVFDNTAIGSTYTSFRYLYDELVDTDYLNDQDVIEERTNEAGFIIGQHATSLIALMEAFGLKNEPLEYTVPRTGDKDYDFFLGNIMDPLYELNGGNSTPGLFIILSDAYYSLGLFKTLASHNIADQLLSLKLTLITLNHLKSSVDSVVALSYRELSQPFTDTLRLKLSLLFERPERQLLRKCEPLRNTLVHYCFPDNVVIEMSSLEVMSDSITNALTFSTDLTWNELVSEVVELGERVRMRIETILGFEDLLS